MPTQIYPLVLCGGMGSRLWPMSRIEQPKQFQPVRGKGSLSYFQTTLQRHRCDDFRDPIVVTNVTQCPLVERQLREVQLPAQIIAEPMGRNTGPAVLAAALCILQTDPDAQLLVLPSDHIITGNLNASILAMRQAAEDGRIVVFGVPPAYPETGYGYLIDGGVYENYAGLHRVEQFIEKPNYDRAKALMLTGYAYWASGISLFRADVLIEEFQRFDPKTYAAVVAAVDGGTRTGATLLLDEVPFAKASAEPTERLIFERSAAVALAPVLDIEWDDIGSWSAVFKTSDKAADGNVLNGDVFTLDTRNSLIQSDSRLIAVVGLHDMVVIDTPDALLVTNRENAQNVKQVVEHLKSQQRAEVRSHRVRETSWGKIEPLARAQGYDVRMIVIEPGATVRVNGTGCGPSLMTFLTGEGSYEKDGQHTVARRGDSVLVAADLALPVTNTTKHELRAVQLMLPNAGLAPGEQPRLLADLAVVTSLFATPDGQTDAKALPAVRAAQKAS